MAKQIPLPKQYPVPANWCWIDMDRVVRMKSGFPFDSSRFSPEAEGRRPLIRIRDVLKGETATYTDEDCPEEYVIHAGEILIGMDGDFNVARWRGDSALLNQRVCCIASASKQLLDDFLYYYLPNPLKKINDATPSVTVKHLSTKTLNQTPLPLPPLAEQRRIVDRIENLFSKLDKAREKAQAVVDGFEDRKAAILHKAFIGELTAQWRKIHNVSLDSWVSKRVNEVCLARAGYAFDSKKFTDSGYQIVRIGNLYGAELDLSRNPVFISKDDVGENVLKRSLIHDGDILITLTGTKYKRDYGYAVCVVNPIGLLVNQRILCLSPLESLEGKYIFYYLQSDIFRDIFFSNETGGVNQGNVSSKFVENIKIRIPTIKEQAEIVCILDNLFEKELQAKEAAEGVMEKIDTMKKAILARAFRGELGTNDPAEEWAGELVKLF